MIRGVYAPAFAHVHLEKRGNGLASVPCAAAKKNSKGPLQQEGRQDVPVLEILASLPAV